MLFPRLPESKLHLKKWNLKNSTLQGRSVCFE